MIVCGKPVESEEVNILITFGYFRKSVSIYILEARLEKLKSGFKP